MHAEGCLDFETDGARAGTYTQQREQRMEAVSGPQEVGAKATAANYENGMLAHAQGTDMKAPQARYGHA